MPHTDDLDKLAYRLRQKAPKCTDLHVEFHTFFPTGPQIGYGAPFPVIPDSSPLAASALRTSEAPLLVRPLQFPQNGLTPLRIFRIFIIVRQKRVFGCCVALRYTRKL